jgi:hypothetical protein
VTETYMGRMLRTYAELTEREVKALVIEEQASTAAELAVVLACRTETVDQADEMSGCTEEPCGECGAPAGRACEIWCIADQATAPGA